MKALRKIAVVAVLLMIAVIVSGCSQKSEKKDVIVLRILENDTAKEKGYLDKLLTAFNKAYEKEGIQAVDANMDEYSNLAENGPYGYGPDVLYQANDKLMTYAADKHLMAISKEDLDCYSVTAKEAFKAFELNVDGKTYTCGIPVNVQEPMLFYRKDQLPSDWETLWDDNQNKVPDFFENWNDLYAYSKQLRDTDDSPNKDSQYGYMSSLNNLYLNANFLFSYGAYTFKQDAEGNYDVKDIGFGANQSADGMSAMIQFAGLMNEGCIDDTITSNRYEKLADGTYFCAVSTPDTYTLFLEKLALHYEKENMNKEQALKKAEENVQMIELPKLMPADGNLAKDSSTMKESDWVPTIVMGGINGYGISAYTKHRDACISFVNFATSYEMIKKRMELLGIAPTRSDVAKEGSGSTDLIFKSLSEGRIKLMPSIKAVDQIWTPVQTLMGDIAKDAFRNDSEKKYKTQQQIHAGLEKASQDVYDAVFTLADE